MTLHPPTNWVRGSAKLGAPGATNWVRNYDVLGALGRRHELPKGYNRFMSKTLLQRTNSRGFPKAAELIEITEAYALEAIDRIILNLLYRNAHDSGRLGDPAAYWEMPVTALRFSTHNGTSRIRESLSRLISIRVKVTYRDSDTMEDRILLTHLFESFDIPAKGGGRRLIRYRMAASLVLVLANSGRWGRIDPDIVAAMTSKHAIVFYEIVQLRANLNRCFEYFTITEFRKLIGVTSNQYKRLCDLKKRVIEPACIEINGLADFGVKVDINLKRNNIVVCWWHKDDEEFLRAHQERKQPKSGRMKRLLSKHTIVPTRRNRRLRLPLVFSSSLKRQHIVSRPDFLSLPRRLRKIFLPGLAQIRVCPDSVIVRIGWERVSVLNLRTGESSSRETLYAIFKIPPRWGGEPSVSGFGLLGPFLDEEAQYPISLATAETLRRAATNWGAAHTFQSKNKDGGVHVGGQWQEISRSEMTYNALQPLDENISDESDWLAHRKFMCPLKDELYEYYGPSMSVLVEVI
jgi:hypothetical protein